MITMDHTNSTHLQLRQTRTKHPTTADTISPQEQLPHQTHHNYSRQPQRPWDRDTTTKEQPTPLHQREQLHPLPVVVVVVVVVVWADTAGNDKRRAHTPRSPQKGHNTTLPQPMWHTHPFHHICTPTIRESPTNECATQQQPLTNRHTQGTSNNNTTTVRLGVGHKMHTARATATTTTTTNEPIKLNCVRAYMCHNCGHKKEHHYSATGPG
jgi:hypothetical protein